MLLSEEGHAATLERYHAWLDDRCDEVYRIADEARKLGYDLSTDVEIPRAADLAGRTEKLLAEHLDGIEIAAKTRELLESMDRESCSIAAAREAARLASEEGRGDVDAIELGLRVGLAILTEAVLVAPLEGICDVRILRNPSGTNFLSVHYAGPIRAAGGTAQAMSVLIADVLRQDMGLDRYLPTEREIERCKEEFGLYRGNLQYRPPPDEIDVIVRSCPVMINGESTEDIEVSGQRDLPNVDGNRIRGGMLLVIGEGMCLKAPKIQKHTGHLGVEGWEFIRTFAQRTEKTDDSEVSEHRVKVIKPGKKFMKEIIAGRPVFGQPSMPGGFRLAYGRARAGGLAAAGIHPSSMFVVDEFLSVGTQMKIERPGKATAVTSCHEAQPPFVLLRDGTARRVEDIQEMRDLSPDVIEIWDLGEIVLGYGEFLENNKNLVPSSYDRHRWASELIEALTDASSLETFRGILTDHEIQGAPEHDAADLYKQAAWHRWLRSTDIPFGSLLLIARTFGTSLPPPHLPFWSDLPLIWVRPLIEACLKGEREDDEHGERFRIPDAADAWSAVVTKDGKPPTAESRPLLSETERTDEWRHGAVKASLLALSIAHHHEGNDIIVTTGASALLEGIHQHDESMARTLCSDADAVRDGLIEDVTYLQQIGEHLNRVQKSREAARIEAETRARQEGKGIKETQLLGEEASAGFVDDNPVDPVQKAEAEDRINLHRQLRTLSIVRERADLRWGDAATIRVGSRMGRPEKAAERTMKPAVHGLFPVGMEAGPKRLLNAAVTNGTSRVRLRKRECEVCQRITPLLNCPHPHLELKGRRCKGRTEPRPDHPSRMTVDVISVVNDALQMIAEPQLPREVKLVRDLMSELGSPEPLPKAILRAIHKLPVNKDGTIRFDMIDVPTTHVMPCEIGTTAKRMQKLGYSHDRNGDPLENDDQMVELFSQDLVISRTAIPLLVRTAQYVDDLLKRFYDKEPYYGVLDADDLIGHLIVGLAPHTSGGVLGRIIGWTRASASFAHPLFHAAKRRNCDGDEDCVMLLLDGLLNFSRLILPDRRGGLMDAPLVLTTRIDPKEIDSEAHNVDAAWFYPAEFYRLTEQHSHPKELIGLMDIIQGRLGTSLAQRNIGYTHESLQIDQAPAASSYKTLKTMRDKLDGQLRLGKKLRGVSERDVASSVIQDHFLPDLRGNLVAFSRQKVRCTSCGAKYRRMPLAGHCIAIRERGSSPLVAMGDRIDQCRGNLILTVSEGAVRKYIDVIQYMMNTYDVQSYTRQRVEQGIKAVDALFVNETVTVKTLADWF